MAFVRSNPRGRRPRSTFGIIMAGFGRLLRWLTIPAIGLALACWCVMTFASLYSASSLTSKPSFVAQAMPAATAKIGPGDPRKYIAALAPSAAPVQPAAPVRVEAKAERVAMVAPAKPAPAVKPAAAAVPADPFAEIAAKVSRDKVLAALAQAGMTINYPAEQAAGAQEIVVATLSDDRAEQQPLAAAMPLPDRFGPAPVAAATPPAAPEAPLAIASAGTTQPTFRMASAATAEAAWGPLARLLVEEPAAEAPVQVAMAPLPEAATKPARRPKVEQAEPEALAFAKPDRPADPKPFNKLFKRQDKVAIYDIAAATVYMPDGSKLEAHSGIGKMADNPKYVHVRNSGPTPPNTYKLTMRESRFYGVEAIRMTPLTKQPMHGRDGFLTHSYLLRSRRPESHGCVAFANYPQFLKAFKQGKVTHLVVVPSLKDASVPKARTQRGA